MMMNDESKSRGYLHEDWRLFHIRDQKDIQIESHYHSFDKVICFLEGDVTYTIEGKEYRLKPRDILLVRHDAVHRPVISPRQIYDRWILYLDPNYIQSLSTPQEALFSCFDLCAARNAHLLRVQPDSHRRFLLLLKQMKEAETSTEYGHGLLSRSILTQILVYLCRFVRDTGATSGDGESDPQIAQVTAYILHSPRLRAVKAPVERRGVDRQRRARRGRQPPGRLSRLFRILPGLHQALRRLPQPLPARRGAFWPRVRMICEIKTEPVKTGSVLFVCCQDQALPLQPSTSTSLCCTIFLMAARAGLRYWRGSK